MPASLLQNRFFIRYIIALSGSFFAYNMLVVAIGWQMYEITNSALSLGLVGLVQFTAHLLFALVAGPVADRYDRRRITYVCQALQAVTVSVLAIASYRGWVTSQVIYICAFAIAASRAFYSTATQALLPTLVERSELPQAISISQVTRNASAIAGPALGGFIYLLGAGIAHALTAAFFLIASVLMASIQLPRPPANTTPATLKSAFAGIAYIRRHPVMLGAVSLDLFAVLLNGTTALLPIYARDILQVGSWGLGLLRAAPAVGATFSAAVLIRYGLKRRVGHILFISVAVFGVMTIVFALSQSFVLSLIALAIFGAADMISVVIRSSLVQLETPDDMRGRVTAVNAMFIGTSNQLGQFQAGVVAALIGAVPALVLGGIATLVVTALWMRLFPGLVTRDALALPAKA